MGYTDVHCVTQILHIRTRISIKTILCWVSKKLAEPTRIKKLATFRSRYTNKIQYLSEHMFVISESKTSSNDRTNTIMMVYSPLRGANLARNVANKQFTIVLSNSEYGTRAGHNTHVPPHCDMILRLFEPIIMRTAKQWGVSELFLTFLITHKDTAGSVNVNRSLHHTTDNLEHNY